MRPLTILPALAPLGAVFLSVLLSAPHPASAGSQKIGQNCSTGDSRLEAGTFAFYDDCDVHAYCDEGSNTCQKKQCRSDIFPFGFNTSEDLPDICKPGFFCPDEQSGCLELLPVGSPCQLNRDGGSYG
jgi:hypothetical protein